MLIVPGLPPLQDTRHSRELGRKVEQLVRDYQRENPDVTEGDVRSALAHLTQGGESSEVIRRRRILGTVIAALTVGAFTAMASTGGELFENNTMVWRIVGAGVALCAVLFAVIRTVRRS